MTQLFDFIKSIGMILQNLITMVITLTESLVAGGTEFALFLNLIPGPAQWFIALCLAVPVVFIVLDILRDVF